MHQLPVTCEVFFLCLKGELLGVDYPIIHVDGEVSPSNLQLEHYVYYHLECHWGASEPEEHDKGFEESFGGEEGSLPLIPFFDVDIVVPPLDVEFGEKGTPCQSINHLWDEGGDIAVPQHLLVQWSVVLDQVQFTVLLFDKEKVGCIGAFRFSDCAMA